MNESQRLEHLISRVLDDEASPAQRRELSAWMRRDAHAAALFDEHAALDREARRAMHRALGRPMVQRLWRGQAAGAAGGWRGLARGLGIAAAACVAMVLWLSAPGGRGTHSGAMRATIGNGGSWFAPPPVAADTFEPDALGYGRPLLPVRSTDRNWIVVPGQDGEFLVIEVNRVQTQFVRLENDF